MATPARSTSLQAAGGGEKQVVHDVARKAEHSPPSPPSPAHSLGSTPLPLSHSSDRASMVLRGCARVQQGRGALVESGESWISPNYSLQQLGSRSHLSGPPSYRVLSPNTRRCSSSVPAFSLLITTPKGTGFACMNGECRDGEQAGR